MSVERHPMPPIKGKSAPVKLESRPGLWSPEAVEAGNNLAASFQQIEDAWKNAEDLLAVIHVPVDCRIKIDSLDIGDPNNPSGKSVRYLCYDKLKTGWRICWTVEDEFFHLPDEQIDVRVRPIVECPLEVRLK